MSDGKYRREARENLPSGYYALAAGEALKPTDLVWSWTSREFLPANSSEWIHSPLATPPEEVICAARKPEFSPFGDAAGAGRPFAIRR